MEQTGDSFASLSIETLKETDLPEAADLWLEGEREARVAVTSAPASLAETEVFARYLKVHIDSGDSIAVKKGSRLVGYLVYDAFDFHGGKAVFSPIIGHAALKTERELIYKKIYQQISERWINRGWLNHYLTFFAQDNSLKELFFKLGFGLYVVDAYRRVDGLPVSGQADIQKNGLCADNLEEKDLSGLKVIRADLNNLEEISSLEKESRDFYREGPLFLVREPGNRQIYKKLLQENKRSAVFLARIDGNFVGYINIRQERERDINTLSDTRTGLLDPLGAYIKPGYRGMGIGRLLLKEAVDWCSEKGLEGIHVDFESANLYGSSFWSKHFTPLLYSVKRTVNRDILQS